MEFITLKNKNQQKIIKGVIMYPLKVNKDDSGVLVETLKTNWPEIYGPGREFAMQYYSITPSGIARDEDVWHFHPTVQEDRFGLIQGEIVVAIADKRDDSETKEMVNLFKINAQSDPYLILIPKNTLHGFLVTSKEPAILINFPTALYNPKEEGRMSFEQAKVKLGDGKLFSWNLVREALFK